MTEQGPSPHNGIDPRWLLLLRTVAVGMIIVLAIPMVAILHQFIPPLGIAGLLFALMLVLTWLRPRIGAIGIGVLSGFWLFTQLVNLSQVIPDLTRPSVTFQFIVTVGMIVFSVAGLIGLVGVLREIPGHIARRTTQAIGVIMLGSLIFSVLSGF